jgi:hypothetical protein
MNYEYSKRAAGPTHVNPGLRFASPWDTTARMSEAKPWDIQNDNHE